VVVVVGAAVVVVVGAVVVVVVSIPESVVVATTTLVGVAATVVVVTPPEQPARRAALRTRSIASGTSAADNGGSGPRFPIRDPERSLDHDKNPIDPTPPRQVGTGNRATISSEWALARGSFE
jgi:hypothetical protein